MKTVYYNGKVYTGKLPLVSAFSVEDGVFVEAGGDELLKKADSDEICIDLKGNFVCSGFNDSHMHLLNYGQYLSNAQLDSHTDSLAGLIDYMKAFLEQAKPLNGRWLTGRGWNHDYFSDTDRMPDKNDLDKISDTVPVAITRCCGHCMAVNSAALKLLKLPKEILQPEGGHIGIENGIPNGLFFDNAMSYVFDAMPLPSREDIKTMIKKAAAALNSYGITSCQSDDYLVFAGVPWKTVADAYRQLEAEGGLSVRVYEQSNFTTIKALKGFIAENENTGNGSAMFKTGPLKLLGDGSLGARTAYLSRPYADDDTTRGFPVFSQQALDELIGYACENGMQTAIHAIGDGCLDMVLDAIEASLESFPKKDHRHGIVHCQITRPDQLERIKRLGLCVYAQSVFLDYDTRIVRERVGDELAKSSYSWKTLMDAGINVSNGSDCPVELPDVMKGIECAVTRKPVEADTGSYLPEQAFSVQEAIDSFTSKGAFASFEEDVKGRIAPGYYADFVVLGENPFEVPAHRLHLIPVKETYLAGKRVFRAKEV